MKTWIIEPHDSFIARDGRPFGLIAGVRAASLPFPFPSTTTGGVRTRAGLNAEGVFDTSKTNVDRVKELKVRGPLLVQLDDEGRMTQWFAPSPADALLLDLTNGDKDKATIRRLVPQELPPNAATNLPDDNLMPLSLPKDSDGQYEKRKPHGYAPRFWNWNEFKKWLIRPEDPTSDVDLNDLGINGLPQDERSHVAIERDSQTSEEGKLFQTRGLEFTRQKQKNKDDSTQLDTASRLALAVATDATNIKTGIGSLGGERRLVCWREFQKAGSTEDIFNSECPNEILQSIIENQACRVVLLTPAYFSAGWKPRWMTEGRLGLQASNLSIQLKAAAMSRPQVVSGWDFETETPKPTRRLVPAGAVFFLKLQGNEVEIKDWINAIWMRPVSDDESSRKDGFGLAALGVWPKGKDMD